MRPVPGPPLHSSYWFDPEMNRSVAVHPDYIRTALTQVYPAGRIAKEIGIP
jgi:hypothetical protein